MSANISSEEELPNSNSDYLLQRLTKKIKDASEVARIKRDYKGILELDKTHGVDMSAPIFHEEDLPSARSDELLRSLTDKISPKSKISFQMCVNMKETEIEKETHIQQHFASKNC